MDGQCRRKVDDMKWHLHDLIISQSLIISKIRSRSNMLYGSDISLLQGLCLCNCKRSRIAAYRGC